MVKYSPMVYLSLYPVYFPFPIFHSKVMPPLFNINMAGLHLRITCNLEKGSLVILKHTHTQRMSKHALHQEESAHQKCSSSPISCWRLTSCTLSLRAMSSSQPWKWSSVLAVPNLLPDPFFYSFTRYVRELKTEKNKVSEKSKSTWSLNSWSVGIYQCKSA